MNGPTGEAGPVTSLPEIRSALVVSDDRVTHAVARRVRRGELVRVFRNVYLDVKLLRAARTRAEFAHLVACARTLAVAMVLGPGAVISHDCAALLWGVDLVGAPAAVHALSPRRQGYARTELPRIQVLSVGVADSVPLLRHCVPVAPGHAREWAGVWCTDLETTAVQCAQVLDPMEASVVVSGVLRRLSGFSRFSSEVSRKMEAAQRRKLNDLVEELPSRRGRRRAREVIRISDAGCESVPEAILVWILRSHGFTVETQVRHRAGNRNYWVDIEIVELGVVIEFDGKGKYGTEPAEILRSLSARDARDKDLESIGLRVLHFEYRELFDVEAVVAEVMRACAMRRAPRRSRLLVGGR